MRKLLLLFACLLLPAPAFAQLTLLTVETGRAGMSTPSGSFNGVAMTSYGTYTGTAPSSATGTWTGCGGGSATIQGLGLNPYPVANTGGSSGATGTFFINYLVASAAGTGCTLTITTNLGTTATTPPTTIFPNAQGTTVTSNVHNAPGWVHSHAYAPANATVTFTNGSANIAWTNVATVGTPVYFETSGSLPTNFSVGIVYYVIATGLSGSNVQVSATVGGSAITAGSAGSGTQTGYAGGAHTRVNNGAGWTESTGTWVPGSALNAYELTSGSCTSAASGGPTGTGSSISDGSCTWKYLSGTDYVSITGFVRDAPAWTAKTYSYGQYVTTYVSGIYRAYSLDSSDGAGGNPLAFCTSSAAPSGVGTGGNSYATGVLTASDGCTWSYMGDILYSSQASSIPFMTDQPNNYVTPVGHVQNVSHVYNAFTASIWNDREYIAGSNSELSPIASVDHQAADRISEGAAISCVGPTFVTDCPQIIYKAATGEGFRDSLTTSTPLTGYDPINGVALLNTGVATQNAYYPSAFWGLDANEVVDGLQFRSPATDALVMWNYEIVKNSIIDGGYSGQGKNTALYADFEAQVLNSLIISHGPNGIAFRYGGVALFNTVVNVGSVSNAVAITNATSTGFSIAPLKAANNAVYNWPHFGAYDFPAGEAFDSSSKNNVTTTTSPDSGTSVPCCASGNVGTVMIVPNSTYNATGSAMFVTPGSDWRPGPALIGAGASYGNYSNGCHTSGGAGCTSPVYNTDTPDFISTPRPQSGSWTVGAEQSTSGSPYTLTGINLSGNTFTYSCSPSTVIGSITVTSSGGTFSSALSLTGANSGGFALSSSSIPSNLIANASTGCPPAGGPFTDISIVATDGTAVGSPLTQPETLTGSGGGPPATQARLKWLVR